MLIYLESVLGTRLVACRGLLGASNEPLPPFTGVWLERFLNAVIGDLSEALTATGGDVAGLRKRLRSIGAIEHRRVRILENRGLGGLLVSSPAKLKAIEEIVALEGNTMGDGLRAVILADFIRSEFFASGPDDAVDLNKLGVVPIFETLRLAGVAGARLGILTGSLVVLPRTAETLLLDCVASMGMDPGAVSTRPLKADPAYLVIAFAEEARSNVVQAVTDVFSGGGVNVLIGTQALLGQGWDAPRINTLLMASNVGSFMLSNQMRGRTIRIDPNDPEKVANIWHLAAVRPASVTRLAEVDAFHASMHDPIISVPNDLGADLKALARRFRAFEGPTFRPPIRIENGIARLGLGEAMSSDTPIAAVNAVTVAAAIDRADTRERWRAGVRGDRELRREMIDVVVSDSPPEDMIPKPTIKTYQVAALAGGLSAVVYSIVDFVYSAYSYVLEPQSLVAIAGFLISAYFVLDMVEPYWKYRTLVRRHGPVEASMRGMAQAVLESLVRIGEIRTPLSRISVFTRIDADGFVQCGLYGCMRKETAKHSTAMAQLLGKTSA